MPLSELNEQEALALRASARRAGRVRGQGGHVKPVGKAPRKTWRGFYYVYERDVDGVEMRRHRSATIGLVSEFTKTQAREKLREIIKSVPRSDASTVAKHDMTLLQFWLAVARPMWVPTWKESSRKETAANIDRYVLRALGHHKLSQITKAMLQIHINDLAATYSSSVVEKARIWSSKLLQEAADNNFITRNPALKPNGDAALVMPETRPISRPLADVELLRENIHKFPIRERIVVRLSVVLGLLTAEILALRRNDVQGMTLRIDEGNRYGKITTPKSKARKASVWMTPPIRQQLVEWMNSMKDKDAEAFLFPAPAGGLMRPDNWRSRFWRPAVKAAGMPGLTLQMCRRTCGTYMNDQTNASPKDIQAHLRHAQASTTMDIYVQEIPASVRRSVEGLDRALFGARKKKST